MRPGLVLRKEFREFPSKTLLASRTAGRFRRQQLLKHLSNLLNVVFEPVTTGFLDRSVYQGSSNGSQIAAKDDARQRHESDEKR